MPRNELPAAARVHRRDRARAAASYLALGLGMISLFAPMFGQLTGVAPALFSGPLALFPPFLNQISRIYIIFGAFGLFIMAKYLRSGNRLAWSASILLLAMTALFHLGKAIDWPVAVLSAATAGWLGWQQAAFPVRPGKVLTRRAISFALAALGVATLIVLGVLLHQLRSTGQSFEAAVLSLFRSLDTELHEPSKHPRWDLLAALLCSVLGMVFWYWFTSTQSSKADSKAHLEDREKARAVIAAYGGGTLDYFALRDDKHWFFLHDSLVAYAVRGSVCLVSPDPIGPLEQRAEIWAEFMLRAERRGHSVTVLAAAASWLPIYERSGLRTVYLGDEAIVDCQKFSLAGKKSKSLRQGQARLQRAGYRVEHLSPSQLPEALERRLEELSTASRRGEAERGFSMTLSRLFDPADSDLMLSIAVDDQGTAQAFIQWVPAPAVDGWSLDIMRRSTDPGVPGGLLDLIIIETIAKLASEGGRGLGLNFAVLREAVADGRESSRLEKLVAKQASKHAQVASLWKFNAKFNPDWQPRYAAVGTVDLWLAQGLRMAQVEGLAQFPGLPTRGERPNPGQL